MHGPGTALGQTDAGHLGLGTEAHGLPGCGLCARPPPLERLEAPGHEDVQCRRLPDTIPAADSIAQWPASHNSPLSVFASLRNAQLRWTMLFNSCLYERNKK